MVDDYSLIVKCKKGDQKAQLELFHRYHNFLLKKYNFLRKKTTSILFDEFEDFEAEAFVYFLKAVDYTNLSKLYDPKKWKFLTPYMYFINNMITDFLNQERLGETTVLTPEGQKIKIKNKTLSLNDHIKFNGKTDGTEYVDYLKVNDEEDPIPRQVIEKLGCESFINTLNAEQKVIFKKMQQKTTDGKAPTILELAQQLGISRPWMALKIRELKSKYRTFAPNWI